MSYDMGGDDMRVVSGINLILNVMTQLTMLKKELEGIGEGWKQNGVFNQVTQIKLILGTAGAQLANDFLVKKLNQLNIEITHKFPHKGMILKRTTESLDAGRIALSKHFQNWENVKFNAIMKALGSHGLIEEATAIPMPLLPNKYEEEYRD